MSTITTRPDHRVDVLHPLVASTVGAVTFAATMVAGDVLELNSDAADAPATTLQDLGWYAGLVLVGLVIAVWLAHVRVGYAGPAGRASLGFALSSVVTFIGFWSGGRHLRRGGIALSLSTAAASERSPESRCLPWWSAPRCCVATSWICLVG